MKKVFILVLAVVLFPSISFAKVIFTEIAWMGSSASQFAEWVELFNDGDAEVDLEGAQLFEGGGSVLVFTLTKKIAPKGYYLIERTTATSPDAVPGVNDDAGSFAGGGFSNSGESLVLKSKTGATLDSVDAAGGWPAGDASTKETMQWNGTAWVTALQTPRAGFLGSGSPSPASESSASSTPPVSSSPASVPSSHSGSASLAPLVVPKEPLLVQAGRDRLGFPGVPIVFGAKGFLGSNDVAIKDPAYAWSFGDGGFATGATVEHAFEFPGEYTVILNGSRGEDVSTARMKVTIVAPRLSITKVEEGSRPFIEITNRSSIEANLWKAELRAGFFRFEFPPDTIIAPGVSVPFAKHVTGLDPKAGDEVALVWPGGRVSSVLTIEAEEKKKAEKSESIEDLQKTVDSLKEQIAAFPAPKPMVASVKPAMKVAQKKQDAVPPILATSTVRIIEIPRVESETGGFLAWPAKAFAFLGGLIFGTD